MSESIWALDSTSLKYATAKHPVWYHKQGSVHFAPVTDGSNAGYVFYVDYSKIDDDSDLRNAVVFHAASSEFSKLSSAEMPTVSIAAVPPDVPSLSTVSFSETNALSISATAPTAISLTSVSYTSVDSDIDASAPTVSTATVSAGGVYGANTAPAYTKPTLNGGNPRVSFEDWWEAEEDNNPFGDNDPGALSITSVPPVVPTITAASVTITGTAPVYVGPSYSQIDTYIDTDDDVELAQAKLQEVNSQVQDSLNRFNDDNVEYQAKLQKDIQDAQLESTEEGQKLQKYSAEVQQYQFNVTKEVQEYAQKLSRYQLEMNTSYTAWAKTESDNIQVFQVDIQNELNEFNKENVSFQANIQEAMQEIQVANQVKLAQGQADLQVAIDNEQRSQERQLQTAVNDMQAIIADNQRKIAQYQAEASHYATQVNQYIQNYTSRLQKDIQDTQAIVANNDDLIAKYQSELQQYASEVQAETAEYQNKIQKQQALSKEADKYYQWAKLEVTTYIQNNSKMIAATMASRSQAAQS